MSDTTLPILYELKWTNSQQLHFKEDSVTIDEKVIFSPYDVESNETPRVEFSNCAFDEDWMKLFGVESNRTCQTEFHIPKNSIDTYLTFKP